MRAAVRLAARHPFAGSWLGLCLIAWAFSLDLAGDSYHHYWASVDVVRHFDWRSLILDIWNKPLTGLLYGIPGQVSLLAARAVGASVVTLSMLCIADAATHLWKARIRPKPVWVIVATLFQASVLPESFLTMTELPAACALSVGLALYARGRIGAAFAAWGWLPLLRVESCTLVAAAWLATCAAELTRWGATRNTWRRAATWAVIGATPFIVWWFSGALVSGNWRWIAESSYARLRPWTINGVLSVNAFNGLSGALSGPMLFFAAVGAMSWRQIVRPEARAGVLVALGICVHLAFLSVSAIYPADMYRGLGVAAVNARNFNVLMPMLALAVLVGVEASAQWIEGHRHPTRMTWAVATFVALISCIGYGRMRQILETDPISILYRPLVGVVLLAAFVAAGAMARHRSIAAGIALRHGIYGALIVATLLTIPSFWYPLRWHDQRAITLNAFCTWYRRAQEPRATRIVQNLSGGLDAFCGLADVDMEWTWPTAFVGVMQSSPSAWVLVATDADGAPSSYLYPLELRNRLHDWRVIAEFRATAQPFWQRALNHLDWKNPPMGWRVYATR